jgi:acetyl esterase
MTLSPLVWALSLPEPLLKWMLGPPVVRDGATLDTQLQALLWLADKAPITPPERLPPEAARKLMRSSLRLLGDARVALGSVVDRSAPGPGGDVPVRVYTPRGGAPLKPLIVYFHGGGWVLGDLETHDAVTRRMARDVDAVVVAVDYRLAPEHPFPAAFDDALAAYRWAVANAAELGADPARVAVVGDSAGGNLAAAVANETHRAGERAPDLQVLIYPVTDLMTEHGSHQTFARGFQLDLALMRWFIDLYVGAADAGDPRVSPLHAPSLVGVAPALVVTGGFDVLRDEGAAYVERLRAAGVPVEHQHHPSLIHGFFSMGSLCRQADVAFSRAVEAMRARLGVAPLA